MKRSHWLDKAEQVVEVRHSHPSVFAQSRLGPRTIAMLLGVILLMSLSCASLAKNFTRYLKESLSLSVSGKVANRDGCTVLSFRIFKMKISVWTIPSQILLSEEDHRGLKC